MNADRISSSKAVAAMAWVMSTSMIRTATLSIVLPRMASSTPPGDWRWPPLHSAISATACSSVISGDGTINAFDIATGDFLGQMKDANGKTLAIDGLWGLAFGNVYANQPVNSLFFTAGPNDEADGLYGRLDPAPGKDHGNDD